MLLSLINRSTVVTDRDISGIIPVLNAQVSDFCGAWQINKPVIRFGTAPGALPVYILDDSDQQGALGYHDIENGKPAGRVFAKTDKKYGLDWRVTLSHEVLELIADPWCMSTVQIGSTTFVAQEVGDPVEADAIGQIIDGVRLSNWVYPSWFDPKGVAPFDRMGVLKAPLTLASGGYVSYWTPTKGWQQSHAEAAPGVTSRLEVAHRGAFRVSTFTDDFNPFDGV